MLNKFRHFICYLIYDLNMTWLRYLIATLCELEMKLPLIFDREFVDLINTANVMIPGVQEETPAQQLIPKKTLYCDCCTFAATSKIARFFFGHQCDGYCYYLAKGDFSFLSPTDLLWDGCKECGINTDSDYDDDVVETQLEL